MNIASRHAPVIANGNVLHQHRHRLMLAFGLRLLKTRATVTIFASGKLLGSIPINYRSQRNYVQYLDPHTKQVNNLK